MINKQTSWGEVADWYDDMLEKSEDTYQSKVIMPNLLRILDPKPNMKVLDVACGQGYFTSAFVENGCQALGCDISSELISKATSNNPKVEFFVSPSDQFSSKTNDLDCITIILALQNIEKLQETFLECAKSLKRGGRLIFVLNHPAFRNPGKTIWAFDDKQGKQYRRIDSYMSESSIKINMTPGEKDDKKIKYTYSFHRPLQIYFKALSKAGFSVIRLEEWISHKKSEKGPRQAEEDRIRKEIPIFLAIEAKKID